MTKCAQHSSTSPIPPWRWTIISVSRRPLGGHPRLLPSRVTDRVKALHSTGVYYPIRLSSSPRDDPMHELRVSGAERHGCLQYHSDAVGIVERDEAPPRRRLDLSLIHISEPTRRTPI